MSQTWIVVRRAALKAHLETDNVSGHSFSDAVGAEDSETRPKCRSPEIVLQGVSEEKSKSFAGKFNWQCDACGYEWTDDGIEKEQD